MEARAAWEEMEERAVLVLESVQTVGWTTAAGQDHYTPILEP